MPSVFFGAGETKTYIHGGGADAQFEVPDHNCLPSVTIDGQETCEGYYEQPSLEYIYPYYQPELSLLFYF